jgi:outer membrane protein assembly factor BamB
VRWVQGRNLPALTLREQSHLMLTGIALYAGHAGGRFSAYALNNGAPTWEGSIGLPKGATELERIADVTGPVAVDDRMVCAAGYQARVACFDRISGNGLWAREISSLRGVDMDERYVYAVNDKGAVLAYSKDKGINPWKQDKLRDRKLSSPLAVAVKFVAVGDYQGHIHLLSSGEGVFTARAATDGSAINGVMLPLKAGLVAQTANGGVYAFKIE